MPLNTTYTDKSSTIIIKICNIKEIIIPDIKANSPAMDFVLIGTIPVGYRPNGSRYFRAYDANNNSLFLFYIRADGGFSYYAYNTITRVTTIASSFTYMYI